MPQHHAASRPRLSRRHHAALTPAPCSTSTSCLTPSPYSTLCRPSRRFPRIGDVLVEPLPNDYIHSGCCLSTACHVMVTPAPTSPRPRHRPSPTPLSDPATTAATDGPRASPMCYGPYPRTPAGPMRRALASSRIPTQLRDLGHHPTCPAIPSASHSSWPRHAALRVALYRAYGPWATSPRHRRPSSPMPSSGWPLHRLPYSPGPTSTASITSAAPLSRSHSMLYLGACPCGCVSSPELLSMSTSRTLHPRAFRPLAIPSSHIRPCRIPPCLRTSSVLVYAIL